MNLFFVFLAQTAFGFFDSTIGNERLSNILWFAGIIALTLLLKKPLTKLLSWLTCNIVNRFSEKKIATRFQEYLYKPLQFLLVTFLFYVAINQLKSVLQFVIFKRAYTDKPVFEIRVSDVADKLTLFFIILFTTLALARLAEFIFHVLIDKAYEEDEKDRQQLYPLLKEVSKILIWAMGGFWMLGSVFQVNIPALITGLGIGGVAIALAAKESVENFFASFTILTDKPFQTGDTVALSGLQGAVERIGFRSTRLRNADGSVYIIPNKKLIGENLENLSQRDNSMVHVVINLKYGLAPDKLKQMIAEMKTMVQNSLQVMQPVAVSLDGFGEGSFQLSVSYHLPEKLDEGTSANDIKQEINLKTYRIVSEYTTVDSVKTKLESTSTIPKAE